MLIDRLDAATPFSFHAQSDGSNIGGVDPAAYGIQPLPAPVPSWLAWTSGTTKAGGYPAVEFYPAASPSRNAKALPRPILPNSGNLALSFSAMLSASAAQGGNVFETDILLVAEDRKHNLSGQRHIQKDAKGLYGQIDIGNWTDTGLRAGPFRPSIAHPIRWVYSFDLAAGKCSVISYSADGQVLEVPAALGGMPAEPCSWPEGVYIQLPQLGSLPSAEPWCAIISEPQLEWW